MKASSCMNVLFIIHLKLSQVKYILNEADWKPCCILSDCKKGPDYKRDWQTIQFMLILWS